MKIGQVDQLGRFGGDGLVLGTEVAGLPRCARGKAP